MPPFPTTINGKIEYAVSLKEQGNQAFRAGQLKDALRFYGKVFAFTRGLPGASFDSKTAESGGMDTANFLAEGVERITATEQQECIDLELAVENNMATIFLKQKNGPKTILHGERAVKRGAENWKAHLRLGQGRALVRDWDGALRALNAALGYAHMDNKAVIQQEIERVTAHQKQENALSEAKQRKSYAGVFERMAATEEES